jgi:agmatine deiminase
LNIVELPLPTPLRGADGQYLARSYLDFYLGMGAVFIPAFDDILDKRAAELIGAAFPDREVVQLDMSKVSHRGRSIHCMTQQQPKVREDR